MKTCIIAGLILTGLLGCSPATREAASRYDTGAVVLDVSEPNAFTVDPNTSDAYHSAYQALKTEDFARAEALLAQALTENPRDPYALLAMGSVMERTGRFYRAADYYRSAIRYGRAAEAGPVLKGGREGVYSRKTAVADVAYANLKRLR